MTGETRKIKVSLTEDQAVGEGIRVSLRNFIAGLSAPQKVELAAKGNREVRQILSRDPNKMVARAVILSPRLSESDVAAYAGSPLTNEDILREIGENKEWMSRPQLVRMLVSNPRTPVPMAMKHLVRLPLNELNLLSRNRNVHAVVRQEAKRLAIRRR